MGDLLHTSGLTATGFAPAKVNLSLHVTGRRPDGYHLLESLILPITLTDTLTLTRTGSPGLTVRCPGHPELETADNLAARAVHLFWELAKTPKNEQDIEITLEKNIPIAAGLGGGSSDAACALRLMRTLYRRPPPDATLCAASVRLGADVPCLYDPVPRWVSGIGEILGDVVEVEPLALLLSNPGYPVSTPWVYAEYAKKAERIGLTTKAIGDRKAGRFLDRHAVGDLMGNDLELVTLEKHPDLFQMKQALRDARASHALMSGSGPTIIGLFESEHDAACARARLQAAFTTWCFWQAANFTVCGDRRGCDGTHGS